jgi:hypothetical protein
MKKSSTTMNVPAKTTGNGAQRVVRMPARRRGAPVWEVFGCVLMASTMPAGRRHVDYLAGSALTSRVIDERTTRCPVRAVTGFLDQLDTFFHADSARAHRLRSVPAQLRPDPRQDPAIGGVIGAAIAP